MDPKIKERWVAKLRSGEYKQGTKRLHRGDNTFCCLGILCELAVEDGVIPSPVLVPDVALHVHVYAYGAFDTQSYLPDEVQEWSGVDLVGSIRLFENHTTSLANLNDSAHSFSQIADLIEAHL